MDTKKPHANKNRSNRTSSSAFHTENWISLEAPPSPVEEKAVVEGLNLLWDMVAAEYQQQTGLSIFHPKTVERAKQLWAHFNQEPQRTLPDLGRVETAWSYLLVFWIPHTLRSLGALREDPDPQYLEEEQWWDIGCGPFSASVAQLLLFSKPGARSGPREIQLIGMDEHLVLPRLAKTLIEKWWFKLGSKRSLQIELLTADLEKSTLPAALPTRLFLTYVLNELRHSRRLTHSLPPAHRVLVVEPAKRKNFERLLLNRQSWIKEQWTLLAPCTHHRACPLQDDLNSRCHFTVPLPRGLKWNEFGSKIYGPSEGRELHYSYLLWGARTSRAEKTQHRVISDAVPIRGVRPTGYYVCGDRGKHFVKSFQKNWKRGQRVAPSSQD